MPRAASSDGGIVDRTQLAKQLRQSGLRDPLTGLANRARFEERLRRALRHRHARLAVLLIDLDNFKFVNDSLGHAAGDRLLIETAGRLARCVRATDMVARTGGDEFAVLLAGAGANPRAKRIAHRVLQALGAPIELDRRIVTPSASIGIASCRSGDSPQDVLRNSDLALYAAKRAGKGRAHPYQPSMHAAALERLELEGDLYLALERNEFVVHYQPLFRLTDAELVGYEALVRWQHPTRGLLAPGTFIELAEHTGVIAPLSRWVLRTACNQIAIWQTRWSHPLEIAVNLSFVNLEDDRIVMDVRAALHESHISPQDLVLEMTESTVTRDEHTTQRILAELKQLGVRITIDDFGTGYSSLSRLSQLPFDGLKIPRPFIERISENEADLALAQGIVDLAHRLGLDVVAEGIETPSELSHARALGCELAQGFHLGAPASSARTNPDEDRSRLRTTAPTQRPPSPERFQLTLVRPGEPAVEQEPRARAATANRRGG
jgi:diguanylate cyclase (GGDEF)-like protein